MFFLTKLFGIEQLFRVERIRLSEGGAPLSRQKGDGVDLASCRKSNVS